MPAGEAELSCIVILMVTGVLEVGAVIERAPSPVTSPLGFGEAQVPAAAG
jgi:hypothetical protein